MKIVSVFMISEDKYFKIQVPEYKKKINYFYPVSEVLHRFDEGTISYYFNNKEIVLNTDALHMLITNFYYHLNKALTGKHILPANITVGTIGYLFNEIGFTETQRDESNPEMDTVTNLWFISGIEIQAWIYDVNDVFYIEISPSYKWIYQESPEEIDDIKMYQEFIKNYKPIAVFTITRKQAQEWLSICEKLIKDLDICY